MLHSLADGTTRFPGLPAMVRFAGKDKERYLSGIENLHGIALPLSSGLNSAQVQLLTCKHSLNPEVEKALIQTAQHAADLAIDMYLGGNGQFAKLAEPIIKWLSK